MDDGDRYPPLELGAVDSAGSAESDQSEASPNPWRRWVALGVALAVGVVVGIVGSDARNDAVEYSVVELVGGSLDPRFGIGPGEPPDGVEVRIINTGPRSIEILGVEIDGFSTLADAEPIKPVTAEPGIWVGVLARVAADCETHPSGAVRAHVRTESGEEFADVAPAPNAAENASWGWQMACTQTLETQLQTEGPVMTSRDATSVTLTLPMNNYGAEQIQIVTLESAIQGFTVQPVGLPVDVNYGGFTPIETRWTVTDCVAAGQIQDATIELTAVVGERQIHTSEHLWNTALVELVRLSERACEA